MRALLLVIGLVFAGTAALSQAIVSDLSQNRVSITANFDGSQIFVFGAVKSNIMADANASPLDVIIEVSGPSTPVLVRKKEKKFGIWVNADSVTVDRAPSFYSLASTRPVTEILSDEEREEYSIGLDYAVFSSGENTKEYADAIIRIRQDKGTFAKVDTHVKLSEETLFTSEFELPSNLVEGDYTSSIYLVRDEEVIAESHSEITVRKVGLERWLYTLAHENALMYGLLSLAVALFAGWGASEIFRLIRK